jgi:hypothetical protein
MKKERYVWVAQDPQNASIVNLDLFTTRKAVIDFIKTEFSGVPIKFIWNADKMFGSVMRKKDTGQWDDMNPVYEIGKINVNVVRRK